MEGQRRAVKVSLGFLICLLNSYIKYKEKQIEGQRRVSKVSLQLTILFSLVYSVPT